MSATRHESFAAQGPWADSWGYARAVRVDDRIEISGTTAIHPSGEIASPGDPYGQTRFVLEVIERALGALGGGLEDVVRTRAFLRSIDDWREVGRAHLEVFGSVKPASSCIGGIELLDPGLLVELEAAAIVGARSGV